MKRIALAVVLGTAVTSLLSAQGGNAAYRPKRLNKMIELLEAGQPVYDVSVDGAGSSNVDNAIDLIKTGVMVRHGTSVELTNTGRAFTKRQMPY